MTTKTAERLPAVPLKTLATRINAEHQSCEKAARSALGHAVECGRLLIEAKKQVEHGHWLPWLDENCEVSERVAQGYMRVAKNLPELESKTKRVSDLPLRDALKMLAEPDEPADPAEPDEPAEPQGPKPTGKLARLLELEDEIDSLARTRL